MVRGKRLEEDGDVLVVHWVVVDGGCMVTKREDEDKVTRLVASLADVGS